MTLGNMRALGVRPLPEGARLAIFSACCGVPAKAKRPGTIEPCINGRGKSSAARGCLVTLNLKLNQQLFRALRPAVALLVVCACSKLERNRVMRTSMRLIHIRDKLKRLAANWPAAMLALGMLLTLVWIGALIWIVFYLFVMSSHS
jgi:hypothetical protein